MRHYPEYRECQVQDPGNDVVLSLPVIFSSARIANNMSLIQCLSPLRCYVIVLYFYYLIIIVGLTF
jgi:hypothetical protein